MIKTYNAIAVNSQGASDLVCECQTSIAKCAEIARRNYGRGWTIIIRRNGSSNEVKRFTIRK